MESKSTIYVQILGYFGTVFELNTSIQHNLISPCVVDTFKKDGIVFYSMSRKLITCRDGEKRKLRKVGLNCDLEGKAREVCSVNGLDTITAYYVSFYVDESICSYCTLERKIRGILGADFINKNKAILNEKLVKTSSS